MSLIKGLLIFIFAFQAFSQEGKQRDVDIVLGIDKVIKPKFKVSTHIKVSNENVLDYRFFPQKNELIFVGIKPGTSSVLLRDARTNDIAIKYLVTVTATDQSKTVKELKELLGDVEGLEITIKGDKVVAQGQIIVPADVKKVVTVLEKYPEVVVLAELSPQTQEIIARKMQEEIQDHNMKNVTVRVVNGSFWLEGMVSSKAQSDTAFQIAAAYTPAKLLDLDRKSGSASKNVIEGFLQINAQKSPPPTPKMIKITSQFVELVKNYRKVFSFNWTPLRSGNGGSIQIGKNSSGAVQTSSNNTFSALISNLIPKLNSAKSAGFARIIQSGVVIVKDRKQGLIKKTNTQEFSLGSGEFTRASKATTGFNLSVTPTVQQEKVDMKVNLSVSSFAGGSAQSTLDNTINTSLIVKTKESAVIGGIVVNTSQTEFDKSPEGAEEAQDGSPLFSFIKSKDFSQNKSQFVVFITPEIIESASEGTQEIRKKFRKRGR